MARSVNTPRAGPTIMASAHLYIGEVHREIAQVSQAGQARDAGLVG